VNIKMKKSKLIIILFCVLSLSPFSLNTFKKQGNILNEFNQDQDLSDLKVSQLLIGLKELAETYNLKIGNGWGH